MGGRSSGGNRNRNSKLTEAIQAYTAMGGEMASKYPYTADKAKLLLEAMSNNEYVTTEDIYRKIDLTESEYNQIFNQLYNNGEIDVNFNSLQSFTKERQRAFTYGSNDRSKTESILYKIPKGTKINGDDIQNRSVYDVEKEVLLGKNNFQANYSELEWTSTNHMILTLRRKR